MKYLYIYGLGVIIQCYFLFSGIYSMSLNLIYEKQQEIYIEFWPFFTNAYHSVVFVFLITLFLVVLIVYDLANSISTNYKKVFLIIESLFLAYTGWGLL